MDSHTIIYNLTMSPSFYFQWHFLEQCNLRCKHCYQSGYTCPPCNFSQIMTIAQQIDQAAKVFGVSARISLTGGEPFIEKEILYQLIDFFDKSENFSHIGILSNGTLITEADAERLTGYQKLKEVQVSLDGATALTHDKTRGHGAFKRATNGIETLVKHGIFTTAMYTITKINVHEAVDVLGVAHDLGVGAIAVERATPTGPRCTDSLSISPEELMAVYASISKVKSSDIYKPMKIRTSRPLWCLVDEQSGGLCPAGISCLAILHDGTLLPCRRLELPIGNILSDGIFAPWYTSPIMWELRDATKLNNKCSACKHHNSCRGCRAASYAAGNGLMGEDPFCWNESHKQ